MKPWMYGYLRVTDQTGDEEVERIERALRNFADTEGFCYATTFYEYQRGSYAVFDELAEELKRTEAHCVVVPSLNHVSTHPLMQCHLVTRLEQDAHAQFFELDAQCMKRADP